MQLDFFNTIHLTGTDLLEAKGKASDQNARVLEIIRKGGKMTPFEVWKVYCSKFPECPLTSIRRAMTTLTDQGKLERLYEMKAGKYGMKNHLWKTLE